MKQVKMCAWRDKVAEAAARRQRHHRRARAHVAILSRRGASWVWRACGIEIITCRAVALGRGEKWRRGSVIKATVAATDEHRVTRGSIGDGVPARRWRAASKHRWRPTLSAGIGRKR